MDELARFDRDLAKLWQELDRAFDNLFRAFRLPDFGALGAGAWPEPEFSEEGRHLVVRLRIPDARPESLEATLTPDQLLVRGESLAQTKTALPKTGGAAAGGYAASYTCFARALPLPKRVKPEEARTEQKDGYLVVRAPLA